MSTVATQPRVCPACGSEIPHGAYVCLQCKQTYCISCDKPILLSPTTGRCRYENCQFYTKPICERCVRISICRHQRDLVGALSFETLAATWSKVVKAKQKYDRRQPIAKTAVGVACLLAALMTIKSLSNWQEAVGHNGQSPQLQWWIVPIIMWAGAYSIYWMGVSVPKLIVWDCCPACDVPVACDADLRNPPLRQIPLTQIDRWSERLSTFPT
jgi:hypothetical protein